MYVKTDAQLIVVAEKCHTKPVVGQEVLSTTPMAGEGIGKETVDTPMSPFLKLDTPPPAESTRKQPVQIQTDELGESYVQVGTGRKAAAFQPKSLYISPASEEEPSKETPKPTELIDRSELLDTIETESEDEFQSTEDLHNIPVDPKQGMVPESKKGSVVSDDIAWTPKITEMSGTAPYTSRQSQEQMAADKAKAQQRMAQEAADRAAKTLAKSVAKAAQEKESKLRKDIKKIESKIDAQTRVAREAVEQQNKLAQERAQQKAKADKEALEKEQLETQKREAEQLESRRKQEEDINRKRKIQADREWQEQFEKEKAWLEQERKMENEKRARDLEKQRLLQEREKIRIQRIQVLGKELQLLAEGKKDLRKNLINRRMEQIAAGGEIPAQRQNRREELVDTYEKYAERLIPVINEYWDIKKPSRRNPYELPLGDQIDYSINYTAQ